VHLLEVTKVSKSPGTIGNNRASKPLVIIGVSKQLEITRVSKSPGITEVSKPSKITGVSKPSGNNGVSKPPESNYFSGFVKIINNSLATLDILGT